MEPEEQALTLSEAIGEAMNLSAEPVAVKAIEAARQCLEQPSAESQDNAVLAIEQLNRNLPTSRVKLRILTALLLAIDFCDEHLESLEEQ